MGINRQYATGTIVDGSNIEPDGAAGVRVRFSSSACKNFTSDPTVGQRVKYLPTTGYAEVVYPIEFEHGGCSMGKIMRGTR